VLQGALSTLKRWHSDATLLHQLDTRGFYLPVAGEILIGDEEHYFEFSDWGWDPQLLSWAAFRKQITERFREERDRYEQRIRALSEARDAIRARRRFKREHLEWFALYQLNG
jgi:hypothetical protein